ncbi:hypothetical protein T484DRAFT_1807038, partial [Baffinella frigidus]
VGNSRAVWEPFVRRAKEDAALRANANPLDAYTRQAVAAAAAAAGSVNAESWLSFDGGDRLVAMQRVAEVGASR